MAPRSGHSPGFTLLEMLVALALMGIIAAALYGSLHIGLKARDGADAAIRPVRRAELAAGMVRRDIEAALPPTGVLAGPFLGEDLTDRYGRPADALVLHTAGPAAPEAQVRSEVRRVEITSEPLEGQQEGTNVIVRRITTRLLAPEAPEPEETVLCRGISEFNLRYYDGSGWLDSWDSTARDNALPLAVELDLEMRREARGAEEAAPYRISRVFRIPCEAPSGQRGGRIMRESAAR